MSFNERLEKWKRYIKQVATKSCRGWVFTSQEDVEQELMLTLWRCHEKYAALDEDRFHRVYSMSVQRTLASLFRRHRHQRQLEEVSLETARSHRVPNGRREYGTDSFVVDGAESQEVGDEFYRSRIREIVDSISPTGLVCMLKKMDKVPPPKSSPVERHAAALRERSVMAEVRELARGA